MSPATMSTVDALLKEVYGPRLEDQLPDEQIALKRIERTNDGVVETVGGKYVDFPIRVTRNTGIGYRNEGEQLPTAGQQGYAEVHVPLKYGYGRFRTTGQVMQLAETNVQAFASAMDNEMDYLKSDVAKDQNRIVYGDGTGLLATITSAAAANAVQTVDNAQYLEIGEKVDVLTKTNGAVVSAALTITDINGLTVTFSAAITPTGASLDGIYREGNYGREPTGFGAIADDTTTLHGLSPTTQRKWAGVVDNPGADRALSEGLMITLADRVRVNGGRTSLIITSLGVRRSYFNLLTQQRRYTDTKEFAGGFEGLAFHHGREIPVIEDPDAPPKQMLFLDESKMKIYRNKEWHWADDDGTVLKWVQDYDVWQGFLRCYYEFGVSQRNAFAVAKRINES